MTLQVAQESRYQGKDWWEWAVWLKGTKAELSVIQRVVYTLHPTFPDPERTIKTRSNGFRLESAGWGGFTIYIKIYRTDGTTIKRKHELLLEYPQQQPQPAKKASKAAAAPPAEAPHPRVYVSSGAADSAFTRQLREALTARGVEVTSAEDLGVGMPVEVGIRKGLKDAAAAVFVVSGEPSLWTNIEVGYALGAQTPSVIPVLVGTTTEAPQLLINRQALHASSATDIPALTDQILRATTKL